MRSIISYISAIVISLVTISCGNSNPGDSGSSDALKITLEVQNAPDMPVYLGGIYGDQYFNVDSFGIENNKAIITMDEKLPGGMYFLVIPDRSINLQILLDKDQEFSLKTDVNAPVRSMEVSGSVDNEALYENLKFELQYQAEYNQIRQQLQGIEQSDPQYERLDEMRKDKVNERKEHLDEILNKYSNTFFADFKIAGQNPDLRDVRTPSGEIDQPRQTYLYINDYWADYNFSDARLLRTPVYGNKLKSYFDRFMPQNADTIIKYADMVTRKSMVNDSIFKYTANYIGIKYKEPTFMGGDGIYAHMVLNFFTDDLAFWANEYEIDRLQQDASIRYSSMIGKKAKDIKLIDLDGNNISLLEIKSPLIVLYFYSPECENCQKETPKLKEIYDEWKGRGVEVFAVTIEPDEEGWRNYVDPTYRDWVNGFDPNNGSAYNFKYHVDVTPEIYVINQDRVIVGKDLKAFQLPTIFQRHLD